MNYISYTSLLFHISPFPTHYVCTRIYTPIPHCAYGDIGNWETLESWHWMSGFATATLKEASLEINILYDTEDEDFLAFKTAYFTNTPMSLFVTDGAATAHGLDADFSITGFTVEQNLEEAVSVKITAKPTASGRAPAWV